MSDAHLLHRPVELLYRIFDYLETQIISSVRRLPELNQFEYFFSGAGETNAYMGTFNHIVASFQTPFWLQEKRWFPTRGYAFKSRTLELHTTTMHMPDTDNFFKVENLAESNTYCFVGEPPKCDREKTLRQLSLDGNKIEDDGAQHLAAALLSNTTLKTLQMSENSDNFCTIVEIAHTIRHDKRLNSLNLGNRQIGDQEVQCLIDTLKTNSTLVSLDLRNNNLSDIGIGLIADTLRKNTTLSRIDLTGNPSNLCTVITIMQRMKCDMSLNNLKVQGCQVGNKGLQYLTDIFQYNKAIVTTNLDNNETDDNGVKHFAYVLRNNPESILWIRDSSIYDMFCGKTLTTLSLSSNRICDDGIKHLVDAIQNNTTLAALDLEGNQIEDREVKYLADLLRTSKTLITMNLQKNRIGVIDAEHLREALQMNTV
ncbi:unnamed protein product [Rotaria socialis]|uniref:Uncharacterized protein n=1 Tax=Rotaria socialis TaxID=392032 RepID=A0A821GYK4_9BILA|nr:unnamed protein product [Rotaria socialis]